MAENANKNENAGKRVIGRPFTSERQPSPLAKSKGWEKRRVKQEIMDELITLDQLSVSEFEALEEDIKNNPENHTMRERRLMKYVKKEKFIKDYLDRHTGKAPQDVDITSGGQSMSKVTVEHIHHLDDSREVNKKIENKMEESQADVIEGEIVQGE